MELAGGDFQAFVWRGACGVVAIDDEGEFAGEDVEELAGVGVVVRRLGGARGHQLFDDVEAWACGRGTRRRRRLPRCSARRWRC